jgi:cell division protein FtsI/penicillin-binding protein 2
MSFGYEIMASLIQLGRAFCIFANGGYLVKPTLLLDPKMPEAKIKRDLSSKSAPKPKLYNDHVLSQMRKILQDVGYTVRGCTVMGKTGTARCAVHGGYSNTEHLYTFVGIVEKGDYKRVIVTFINRPQKTHLWASEVAAPLFQKVAERMIVYESADKGKIMV